MNYDEAIEYIHGTLKFGSKLGLHNIGTLLVLMGNPHKKLKFVHVAGTNGKGSVVAFISSILKESGYKAGIFTSPFLQRFTERIKINDNEIGKDELAAVTAFVKEKTDMMLEMGESHPTEFEIVTAIALQYFFLNKCDIVVLEVGLGGRFDSTNIIDTPDLAVISTINYDHTDRLGSTLPAIASEKAGIIKPNGDVITFRHGADVMDVFGRTCTEKGARLHIADLSKAEILESCISGQVFNFDGFKELFISLPGRHQVKNACIAVNAARILMEKGYCITETAVRNGLRNARWPGRLEVLGLNPVFLIDGAHNVEGAKALKLALDEYFKGKRMIFIMGVMSDKDYSSMAKIVLPGCRKVITVTPDNQKALSGNNLAKLAVSYCKDVQTSDTIKEAVGTSLAAASTEDVICAFGSLYYIGKVREIFGL